MMMGRSVRPGWIILLVLGVVLALSLAACSDDDSEADAIAPTATPQEPATVVNVIDPWVRATVSGGAMGMDGMDDGMDADMDGMDAAGDGQAEDMAEGETAAGMSGGMEATDLITAAFMTLENAGDTDERLVSVAADVTQTVEIHETTVVNEVMQMRPIEGIDVPAGERAILEPGGKHIMLIGVPVLAEGDTVALTLTFESGLSLTVDAPVRPLQ